MGSKLPDGEGACSDVKTLPPAGQDGPLQLIKFVLTSSTAKSKTIQLNQETLDVVFQEIGDRPISVICVCGPSRQGKSFLLGYMIRCLEALEKGDEDDWMDWDNSKKPLHGFMFKTGIEPETQGIWVWSRPFIVKGDDGSDVAVLLLDTQGTYDEFTSTKDMSAIVGLSLLASSVMIFNFFTNLQENILVDLNTYIQYGSLALDNAGGSGTPFQKLHFLIRDWNIPSRFPYGEKGGKLFLKEKLKVKDGQSKEANHVREMIGKCFQELDCFLMPGIGEAALELDFTGSIDELAPKFAKALEDFISSLLIGESLPIKEIMGSPVSASRFKSCLEDYIKIFNSEEVPSSEVMWQATSQMSNNNVIDKAEKQYRDSMKIKFNGRGYFQEEDLNRTHSTTKNNSLAIFTKSKIFGDAETISQCKAKLEALIENAFHDLQTQNEMKRQAFITDATTEAKNSFRSEIKGEFPFAGEDNLKFYDEMMMEEISQEVRSTILQEFEQKLSSEPDDKLAALCKSLQEIFDTIVSPHVNQNQVNKANAERFMSTLVENLSTGHRTKFQDYLESNKFEEDKTVIQNNHDLLTVETIELYNQNKISDNQEFHKHFLEKMEGFLVTAFTEMTKEHMLHVHQILQDAEISITTICDQFESELRIVKLEAIFSDKMEELEEKKKSSTLEKIQHEVNPFPPESPRRNELEEKATKNLQNICDKLKAEVAMKRQQSLESWESAQKHAYKYYQREMKTITDSADFFSDEDLQAEHNRIEGEAIKDFDDMEKIDAPPNALKIKNNLKMEIIEAWWETRKQNQTKLELTKSNAKNYVRECADEYKKTMTTGLKHQQQTNDEFRTCHLNAKGAALLQFKVKCQLRDPTYLEEYEDDLENRIEEMFNEIRIKKEREENLAMREILPEARKHYHDEMKKRCENEPFINPKHLPEIHEQGKDKRAQEIGREIYHEQDLQNYLDSLFGIYLMQNDMKLNSEGTGAIPAIGIDLGTTNCCVAVYYKGKVHIIPNQQQGGSETTPSYVAFNPDGNVTIGEPAKRNAHKDVMPERTIYDAKRIIGRKITDPELQSDMKFWPFTVLEHEGVPKIICDYEPRYPEEIAGRLLAHCKIMAESFLGLKLGTIKKAVITVPAYFNDGQRQATVDAGKLANLDVLTIMNEPTAAAIAYSLKRLDADPRKILIYDLGGGTFDVAVLDVQPKEIKVLGVKGDTHLGGEDFDKKMMEHCVSCFHMEHGIDLFFGRDSHFKPQRDEARRRLRRLQTKCEGAKRTLATADTAQVFVAAILDGRDLNVTVTRKEFETMNMTHFDKSIRLIAETLEEVGLRKQEIDDVVLVGGSSRIPKVQEMLQTFFEEKALNKSIHPDLAVAYGAAVQAALMNGEEAKCHLGLDQIQDVTPMSLGIEVASRELSVILPKNTRIPARRKEVYETVFDNQTSISVDVYQGDDLKKAVNNKLLGKFILNGIPPKPQGAEPLDIWMEVNSMGILHVEAICRSTQGKNSIVVEENKQRMSKETIAKLLKEEEARKLLEMVPSVETAQRKATVEVPQNDTLQMVIESNQFEIEMLRPRILAFQGPHVTNDYKALLSDCENIKFDLDKIDVTGTTKKGVKMDALQQIEELRRALTGKVHAGLFCPQCVK